MIMTRCDRADPARVAELDVRLIIRHTQQGNLRIDNGASYGGTLNQTEILGSFSSQATADRLTSRQNETVLARRSADLIVVALHQRFES